MFTIMTRVQHMTNYSMFKIHLDKREAHMALVPQVTRTKYQTIYS